MASILAPFLPASLSSSSLQRGELPWSGFPASHLVPSVRSPGSMVQSRGTDPIPSLHALASQPLGSAYPLQHPTYHSLPTSRLTMPQRGAHSDRLSCCCTPSPLRQLCRLAVFSHPQCPAETQGIWQFSPVTLVLASCSVIMHSNLIIKGSMRRGRNPCVLSALC